MASPPKAKRVREEESDTGEEDQRPAKRIMYDDHTRSGIAMSRADTDRRCYSTISNFKNIITVLVGPDERGFILHQDLVCTKSKFFRAACSKQWLEGQEKVVRLPEAKVAAFQMFCHWVYFDDIAKPTRTGTSDEIDVNVEQKSLVELYLLGDTLDDVSLRNRTKSMLLTSMHDLETLVGSAIVRLVWTSTPPGSLLRKMIVDVTVGTQTAEDFAKELSEDPPEFVQEVAVAALRAFRGTHWSTIVEQGSQYMEDEEQ
jgi:hypothetical protein